MTDTYVTSTDFKPSFLRGSEPDAKNIPNQPGQSYSEIKLSYNYGTEEQPIITGCYFELPEIECNGIVTREDQKTGKNGPYTKVSSSQMIRFNLQNEEVRECLEKFDQLHSRASHIIGKYKGKLKMHDFDPERPGSSFKNPIYYARDENTGEKIKGRNPSLWVKLNNWSGNKTLFTDLNGTPINWDVLKDVDMKMVPLLHVEKIYIGSKASLQLRLTSAIVTEIHAANTVTKQMSTLERLKAKRRGLADQVSAQLAQLKLERNNLESSLAEPESEGELHSIPKTDDLSEVLDKPPSMAPLKALSPF